LTRLENKAKKYGLIWELIWVNVWYHCANRQFPRSILTSKTEDGNNNFICSKECVNIVPDILRNSDKYSAFLIINNFTVCQGK